MTTTNHTAPLLAYATTLEYLARLAAIIDIIDLRTHSDDRTHLGITPTISHLRQDIQSDRDAVGKLINRSQP